MLLQALTANAQGNQAAALAALESAVSLAAPEGYVRIFVDEGAPMAALLAQRVARRPFDDAQRHQGQELRGAQHDPIGAYAERLLAAFPSAQPGAPLRTADAPPALRAALERANALVEPLSEREREILRLIAGGLSNQAIADTLIIATSTVKKHINNIYGKLDVQSRTQALVRARELHLL